MQLKWYLIFKSEKIQANHSRENTELKKIAVFVDVQNIYYTTRQAYQKQFNYRALWRRISDQGEIVLAKAYAIDRHDEKQRQFQSALRSIGFEVKLKPFIQRSDGSAKGDWDVGITIDILQTASNPDLAIDTIILLSGDGDFDMLMKTINNDYGITGEAYGVSQLSADSLINSVQQFNPIDESLLQ